MLHFLKFIHFFAKCIFKNILSPQTPGLFLNHDSIAQDRLSYSTPILTSLPYPLFAPIYTSPFPFFVSLLYHYPFFTPTQFSLVLIFRSYHVFCA